jgi:hypothetical protein
MYDRDIYEIMKSDFLGLGASSQSLEKGGSDL